MSNIIENLQGEESIVRLSIVIPTFNPGIKLEKCLNSLRDLDFESGCYEVLFIDDSSTDGTYDLLKEVCRQETSWHLHSTDENSGSPSKPRNIGIQKSKGSYIFFLDCDDEIIGKSVNPQLDLAFATGAEIVRSPLLVDHGSTVSVMNTVQAFESAASHRERIQLLITNQSTTNSSLIRRDFLIQKKILWPESNHMGEDTIFLVDVLCAADRIEYYDEPTIVYHKSVGPVRSSTQRYGSRELNSHLEVWEYAESRLSELGISYIANRGGVALGYALKMLIKFGLGTVREEEFKKLSHFTVKHWDKLSNFNFSKRVAPIIEALNNKDFKTFESSIRPRLLIAGYDLKFIRTAIPALEQFYEIKVDEWSGHEVHDEARSRRMLAWADTIFCEWLLGNAVWYSKHKRKDQVLIVRLHRFETSRNYGHELHQDAVNAFISVSVETVEDMIRTFKFDRRKCRVVANYLEIEKYHKSSDPERILRLALVGAIPARKGLLKALQLLRELRIYDKRYELTLFGKTVAELPWVANDPSERAYFAACDRYIADQMLGDAVSHGGWVAPEEVIHDYGFVLSTSDAESFHVSPAEGFVAGNQGVFLSWPGVEYVYPDSYIFSSVHSMRDYILQNRTLVEFEEKASEGREYVLENYSLDTFISRMKNLMLEV